MTDTLATGRACQLDGDALRAAVLRFADNPLYVDNDEWQNDDNPYRRQLRPHTLADIDFGRPLDKAHVLDYASLAAQRLLTTIYETDLVLLPKGGAASRWDDFHAFYGPVNRALGETVRPGLERFAFGFLDEEVEVSGAWTPASLDAYLRALRERRSEPSLAERAIATSSDPRRAARMWLVQFAPDFLSEASPMIRNVLGNYGPPQSEWFKIVIDEYGAGVHSAKHSALYERTLRSVGLGDDLHRYWQFYLTGSLLANNYFHYLGRSHELLFRYLGAMYATETVLVDFCRRAARLLTDVFDGAIDVEYFAEHVHIDRHHSEMALDKVVRPMVQAHGDIVIPEIVRGVEELELVTRVADEDFAAQVAWMDGAERYRALHDPLWDALRSGRVGAPVARLVESRGELSNTHCHDGDELCHVTTGTMRFVSGLDAAVTLQAGEGTVIRRNRLHGAFIESDQCQYEVYSVGDHAACMS